MTKKCCKCKRELSLEKFSANSSKKDGIQAHCKTCQKEYRREHYLKNKQKYIDKADRITKAFRSWYQEYKEGFSCKKCGENHPSCIQFHHNNDDKDLSVARLASYGNKQRVIDEIAKCVPLCANCHAKEHYNARLV